MRTQDHLNCWCLYRYQYARYSPFTALDFLFLKKFVISFDKLLASCSDGNVSEHRQEIYFTASAGCGEVFFLQEKIIIEEEYVLFLS